MPSKLDSALALAAQDFFVFPCEKNGKKPVVEWRDLSSTNPKTIKSWWSADSSEGTLEYNIGIDCFKSGLTVVDIDVKDKKQGRESYEKLQAAHGWPDTYTVKTPTGGIHLYYMGRGYRNSVSKLAPGIDIRGDGGYVVAPGSSIDGRPYELKHRRPAVKLPDWLKEALTKYKSDYKDPKEKKKKVVHKADEIDIDWAKDYLADREPAVEGAGGDQHTFATICALKDRGVHPATALELISELWNPTCCPPWDYDDLKTKVENAYQYGKNQIGAGSGLAVFDAPPATTIVPTLKWREGFEIPDANSFKPRDWVFGEMWQRQQVGMIISQPGIGKSTFTLSMGMSKVTDKNLLDIDPKGRGAVAIFNNEDTMEEQARRITAAAQYHGIRSGDLNYPLVSEKGSMLFLNGRDTPLRIAKRLADNRLKAADCNELIDYILEREICMAIFDPFAMTHPAMENSNEEIMQIGMLYNHVAEKANCAVVLVHHTRKRNIASGEGHSGNLDSSRGASSLAGLVRSAYTLDSVSQQEAKRKGIADNERHLYILLEQAKANMSAPGLYRKFYKRHGEIIGRTIDNETGESVGVLLPAHMKDITPHKDQMMICVIKDIESLLDDGAMSIPDIARTLIRGYPFHSDKDQRTLEKYISRLMSEGILTGFKGTLHLEERETNNPSKPSRFISLRTTPIPEQKDLSDLI